MRPMKAKYVVSLISTLLLLSALLVACGPGLPFETIAGSGEESQYREEAPQIIVIASQDEIASLGNLLPERVTVKLQDLNYEDHFAILVLHGYVTAGMGQYKVTAREVVRQNAQVHLKAEFEEPQPGGIITLMATSPYHLITVSKRGDWNTTITLLLLNESGKQVAETEHFIP